MVQDGTYHYKDMEIYKDTHTCKYEVHFKWKLRKLSAFVNAHLPKTADKSLY